MKLMVVDDDIQIREGIVYGISWENIGIHEAVCCKDAYDALDQFKESYFDIVLTDISMPGMSGITLLEKLKEQNPDVTVILISGYEDFEYARAGIKYGAEDYILKPIHLDVLTETIRKAASRQKKNRRSMSELRENTRNKKFRKIIHGSCKEQERIQTFLAEDCKMEKPGVYMGILLKNEEMDNCFLDEEMDACLSQRFMEGLAGFHYCIFYIDDNEKYILIQIENSSLFIMNLKCQIREIINGIRRHTGKSFTCSVYAPFTWKELQKGYKKGKEMLRQSFFRGPGSYIEEEKLDEHMLDRDSQTKLEVWNKEMLSRMEVLGDQELQDRAGEMKGVLYGCSSEEVYKFVLINLTEIGHKYDIRMTKEDRDLIYQKRFFEELMDYWIEKLMEMKEKITSEKTYSKETKKIIEYVRQNYQKKIVLNEIAEILQMSTGHMSRKFKEETGYSLKQYIKEYRIKQAVYLLETSELKVYEIAELVGIPDYIYFSQIFKSVMNQSPYEVRKEKEHI